MRKKEKKVKTVEKVKTNKKLNKHKLLVLFEIIILIGLITGIGVKVYFDFFKDGNSEPSDIILEKNAIKEYGYKLEDRDTKLYEVYFDNLKTVLEEKEIDYKKYAELLAKLFVSDFYTLSNKITSTDIGGLDFLHPDAIENFKLNAGDTMYKTVLSNVDGKRTQNLPEVSDVIVESVNETTFNYNEELPAYEVKANWTYKEDLGYDTSKTLIIVKKDNKLYIVSSK